MRVNRLYIIIIIGMNVVDNLNSVQVINKPCVCTRTMRLSTFSALRRDREQEGNMIFEGVREYDFLGE